MTTRRFAVVLGCAGVAVVLAFGYAALQFRGEPIPERGEEMEQSPVTQVRAPVSETPEPAREEAEGASANAESAEEEPEAGVRLDPARVAAARAKVEHIRNNLHLYGAFHPEAEAIIAELIELNPTSPNGYESEAAAEYALGLFDRLISLKDPRSAETLVLFSFGGGGSSSAMDDAIEEWGAASIPFLLEIAMDDSHAIDHSAVFTLKRIVNRHPDLDPDIVTCLLEPLFEKHKRRLQRYQEWGLL